MTLNNHDDFVSAIIFLKAVKSIPSFGFHLLIVPFSRSSRFRKFHRQNPLTSGSSKSPPPTPSPYFLTTSCSMSPPIYWVATSSTRNWSDYSGRWGPPCTSSESKGTPIPNRRPRFDTFEKATQLLSFRTTARARTLQLLAPRRFEGVKL